MSSPDTRTEDHVHLASRGGWSGRAHIGGKIENKRPSCYECNEIRNTLGHCCGLLMLVLIEARARGEPKVRIMDDLERTRAAVRIASRIRQLERRRARTERRRARGELVARAVTYGI